MKKKPVDVCIIIEDGYPYINSDLADHIHLILKASSSVSFCIIYIDSLDVSERRPSFDLPPNVFSLDIIPIYDLNTSEKNEGVFHHAGIIKSIDVIHRFHKQKDIDENRQLLHISQELSDPKRTDYYQLFNDEHGWQFILQQYEDLCPTVGFMPYYETVATLHYPLFKISRVVKQQNSAQARFFHSWSSHYAGFMGMLLSKRFNRPLAVSELLPCFMQREFDQTFQQGHFENTDSDQITSENQHQYLQQLISNFDKRIASLAYRQASYINAFDKYTQDIQHSAGAQSHNLHRSFYSLDLATVKPLYAKRHPQPSDQLSIVCIGPMHPSQDFVSFIKSIAILKQSHNDLHAKVIIKGEVNQQYYEHCRHVIAALQLQSCLTIDMFKNFETYLLDANVVVSCAVENFQYHVLLFALALEIPIVATKNRILSEILLDVMQDEEMPEINHLFTAAVNAENVAKAIEHWVSHDVSIHMSTLNKIRRHVERKYAVKRVMQKYLSMYQTVKEHTPS